MWTGRVLVSADLFAGSLVAVAAAGDDARPLGQQPPDLVNEPPPQRLRGNGLEHVGGLAARRLARQVGTVQRLDWKPRLAGTMEHLVAALILLRRRGH